MKEITSLAEWKANRDQKKETDDGFIEVRRTFLGAIGYRVTKDGKTLSMIKPACHYCGELKSKTYAHRCEKEAP